MQAAPEEPSAGPEQAGAGGPLATIAHACRHPTRGHHTVWRLAERFSLRGWMLEQVESRSNTAWTLGGYLTRAKRSREAQGQLGWLGPAGQTHTAHAQKVEWQV